LLCNKVHIPQLDLPKLDINFRGISGKTDKFHIHPEECCYGSHCGFKASDVAMEGYQKCGRDATSKRMPMHERVDVNEQRRKKSSIASVLVQTNTSGKAR